MKVAGAGFKTRKDGSLQNQSYIDMWSPLPEDTVGAGTSGSFTECLKKLL